MAAVSISIMQLVRDAYFLTSIINEQNPLSAAQFTSGVSILNYEINSRNSTGMKIPYFTEYTFNLTPGKADYSFGQLSTSDEITNRFVSIDYIDYICNGVQYYVRVDSTKEWKQTFRQVTNLQPAPPQECFVNQNRDETVISFYFPPDQAYVCTVRGKQVLDQFTSTGEVLNVPPYFYKLFLYVLGAELSRRYPGVAVWTDAHQKELMKLLSDQDMNNQVNLDIKSGVAMLGASPSSGNYLSPIFTGF